jgi:excisionase family DNA binding protein
MTLHRSEALSRATLQDAKNAKDAGDYILDLEAVARILDLSPSNVRGLARQGKLRARRMGTRWRFRRDDVRIYLTKLSQIDKSI